MNEKYRCAAIAYDAYCKQTGGRSLATGDILPPFDALRSEIKDAWAASAIALSLDAEMAIRMAIKETARCGVVMPESIDSLKSVIAFHVRDWSLEARDAWLYGIVMGWKSGLHEVATRHRWSKEDVSRLQRLHREFSQLVDITADSIVSEHNEIRSEKQ